MFRIRAENRILILRGGAVGDFILTLPVFDALRRQWPKARIELAGYPRVKRLALKTGLADAFHSLEGAEAARLFAREQSTPWIRQLGHFDAIVSYLHDPDGVVGENLARAGAKRVVCASPLVTAGHAVDHLLKPLAELGVPVKSGEVPRLRLPRPQPKRPTTEITEARSEERKQSACGQIHGRDLLSPRIAIHPGSGSAKKNWPAEKFAELAKRIRADGFGSPFFSLGEADDAVGEALARLAPDVPVLRGLDLLDLAGVLSTCSGYVGNDSGITHLAAAVGIPVVALFGPTDPAVWGPRGENVRILRAPEPTPESLARIDVDEVLALVRAGSGRR